jgi:hypothetical protein
LVDEDGLSYYWIEETDTLTNVHNVKLRLLFSMKYRAIPFSLQVAYVIFIAQERLNMRVKRLK